MTEEQKAMCHKIADHYGETHQMLKAVEEMSELAQVIIKAVNDPPKDKSIAESMKADMLSELADVIIMTEQLVKYVADNDCATLLDGMVNSKLNRQFKRMGVKTMDDSNLRVYPELKTMRPFAEKRYSFGIDGRDARWVVDYFCTICGNPISKGDIACGRCGTIFDWSKTAHIRMNPEIVWE